MNNKLLHLLSLGILLLSLLVTSCDKKRISYTDMIKRETKEINAFMDKQGFKTLKGIPDRAFGEKEFAKLKDGEVYLRIIKKGAQPKSLPVTINVRFNAESIGTRSEMSFATAGPSSSGSYPLPIRYYGTAVQPTIDPQATALERQYESMLCEGIIEIFQEIGFGGEAAAIVSFRKGPSFASRDGIALYFERITFEQKP